MTFINNSLQQSIKHLTDNVTSIRAGIVGGSSIEVEWISPKKFDSYLYPNSTKRDADLKTLIENVKITE